MYANVGEQTPPAESVLLLGCAPHPHADEILRLAALAAITAVTLEQSGVEAPGRARAALTIGPALEVDSGTSGDLLETLRVYLEQDGRLSKTADAIHGHRHTIGYRLTRIADLTGHDPKTPRGQRRLTLGLQALALRSVAGTI